MKQYIRILAFTLLTALTLSSCGASGGSSGSDASQSIQSGASDSSQTAAENPTVEITFWEQGWDGPIDDQVLPIINEKAGVNLVYKSWVVTSDEEQKNKLSLLAASGTLPDVYFGSSDNWTWSLFNKLGEQDKLWDLIPFIRQNPNVESYVSISVPAYIDPTKKELYMLPTQMGVTPRVPLGYNIRQDWLDQLGVSYPQTTEDFYNVLKKFKEMNPNVIPLAFSETVNEREKWWIIPWFGEDAGTWSKQADGVYTMKHYTDMNGLTKMAVFFNRLYREGLLDQEALTIKNTQLKEKIAQNRVGVELLNDYETSGIVDELRAGEAPKANYVMTPHFFDPEVKSGTYLGNLKLGPAAPSGLYVSKALNEEQVSGLFRALDFILTKDGQILVNYGIENNHWNYDENNKIVLTPEFYERSQNDWNKMAHEGVQYYQQLGNNPNLYMDLLPEESLYGRPNSKYNEENEKSQWSPEPTKDLDPMLYVTPNEQEQSLLPSIDQAWRDMLIKAILADSEEKAKEVVSSWPSIRDGLGWMEVAAERNETVKTVITTW